MSSLDIKIISESDRLLTSGLSSFIGHELKINVKDFPVPEYYKVLKYLIDYCKNNELPIKHNQTIAFHSWLLKCVLSSDLHFSLWEVTKNGSGFTDGAEYALEVVLRQREVCERYNTLPSFPTFSQKVVISKGVYEGLPIEGVRYPSPDHMTGWWLTTDEYDGNIKSLQTVHYFHVAFKRPDLLKYFALPNGYRFFSGKNEDIWFDAKILLTAN